MRKIVLPMSNRNHIVLYVFTFFLLITYILLAFLMVTHLDYKDYLLRDDGYYPCAKNFARGIFKTGGVIGPGLPIIYAPIHFFNEKLHPFIRLFISQIAVLLILFIISKLTIKYLNNKQLFLGLLLVVIHPTFIQWSFRTSVDLFLSLFLGLFILFLYKYINKGNVLHIFISFLAYSYAIFTRPSFILIPIVLLIVSLVILKSNKIILISFALFLTSGICFYANNLYLQKNIGSNRTANSHRSLTIIYNLMITKTILETGQFHKGTIDAYNIQRPLPGGLYSQKGVNYLDFKVSEFVKDYKSKYPDRHFSHMLLYYVKKHPMIAIAKILLGPVFFFALSSREIASYLLLLFFVVYSILTWLSLKPFLAVKENRQYFVILFSVLFGYFLLHWATHAYSRYSLVILPYLFVWTGPQILHLLGKCKVMLKQIK